MLGLQTKGIDVLGNGPDKGDNWKEQHAASPEHTKCHQNSKTISKSTIHRFFLPSCLRKAKAFHAESLMQLFRCGGLVTLRKWRPMVFLRGLYRRVVQDDRVN